MTFLRALLPSLVLAFSLTACKKESTEHPDDHGDHHAHEGGDHDDKHGDVEGREVVVNYEAKTGDVTICPVSGEKFEVKDDSPRFAWEGQSWVTCCGGCQGKVEADPEKYLRPILTEHPPAGGDAAATEPGAEAAAGG